MEEQPFISVILLDNYHPNQEKFIKCLKSITSQDYNNYEIILGLYNKTGEPVVQKLFKEHNINTEKIQIYATPKNLGYAGGNNALVKKANYDLILISNADVEVAPDFLFRMARSFRFLEEKKKTDKIILGPRICNYHGIIEFSRRKINFLGFSNVDIGKTEKIRATMVTSGCAFMMHKSHFQELGGFDYNYFLYHEDIDFSIRSLVAGYKQYVDNSIHLYHLRSDQDYKLTKFKYYYHERNRITMTIEHTPRKFRMILSHIIFEPLHIVYAIQNGFFKERIRVLGYLFFHMRRILNNRYKINDLFDRYYEMDGIFNEVNKSSIVFRFIDFMAKALFRMYHSKVKISKS